MTKDGNNLNTTDKLKLLDLEFYVWIENMIFKHTNIKETDLLSHMEALINSYALLGNKIKMKSFTNAIFRKVYNWKYYISSFMG